MLDQLRAVLANFGFSKNIRKFIIKWIRNSIEMEIFENLRNLLTQRSVSLRRVRRRAVLACAKSNFLQISPRKRTLKQNHFSLFVRGPDGFYS